MSKITTDFLRAIRSATRAEYVRATASGELMHFELLTDGRIERFSAPIGSPVDDFMRLAVDAAKEEHVWAK